MHNKCKDEDYFFHFNRIETNIQNDYKDRDQNAYLLKIKENNVMNFLKLLFSPYLVPKLLSTDSKPQTPSSQHHTLKPQRHRPRHHLPKPLLQPAPPFHLIKTSSSTFISHSPFAKKFKTRSEISQTLVPVLLCSLCTISYSLLNPSTKNPNPLHCLGLP